MHRSWLAKTLNRKWQWDDLIRRSMEPILTKCFCLKQQRKTRKIVQRVKFLEGKEADLNSDPLKPHRKLGMAEISYNPSVERRSTQGDAGNSLANPTS